MMTTAMASKGKATTIKTTFSCQTSISIDINSDASIVWALLTKAFDYPNWNSTITSIEGNIALGEKIKLKSTLDAKRTFNLKVKEFEPERRLVWGDAMGTRVYTLTKNAGGTTTFSMIEKIGGPLFPLFAKMIPPFDQSFEKFAGDLKKAAEAKMSSK